MSRCDRCVGRWRQPPLSSSSPPSPLAWCDAAFMRGQRDCQAERRPWRAAVGRPAPMMLALVLALVLCARADEGADVAEPAPEELSAVTFVRDIKITKRGMNGERNLTVFQDTAVQNLWFNCPVPEGDIVPRSCYFHDKYADRVVFDVWLRSPSHFQFYKPIAKAYGSEAEPVVINDLSENDVELEDELPHAEFTVLYNCMSAGLVKAEVTVPYTYHHVTMSKDVKIVFSWIHMCGDRPSENVRLLYVENEQDKVPVELPRKQPLRIAQHQDETTFIFTLYPPAKSQQYGKPFVVSSHRKVLATVEGKGGVALAAEQHPFVVSYKCLEAVRANITLSIPLPPSEPLSVTYQKDCLREMPVNTRIIATNSRTVIYEDGAPKVNMPIYVHSDQAYLDLLVSNDDKLHALELEAPTLTAEHTGTLLLRTEVPRMELNVLSRYAPESGMWLRKGESTYMRIRFVCKTTGKSQAFISLRFKNYEPVEFTVLKSCRTSIAHAREIRPQRMLMSLLWITLILCALNFALKIHARQKNMHRW